MWDNIPRGTTISCPSIEKSLTASVYSDRVLGVTETRIVPSTTVSMFTGNNIGPRGDLASRSLQVRLAINRPDPENRVFAHADPIAWTTAHRGNILHALYVLMLGNPRLRVSSLSPAERRFKKWWHLIGSAVEYAAAQHAEHVEALVVDPGPSCRPAKVSFRDLFLGGEADEEQTSSLAIVLDPLCTKWLAGLRAADLANYLGQAGLSSIALKGALEQASGKLLPILTPTGNRPPLTALLCPVRVW